MGDLSPVKQTIPEILIHQHDQRPKSRVRRSNTSPVRTSFDPKSREFVPVLPTNTPAVFQNAEHVFRPSNRIQSNRFQGPSTPQHHNASLSANDRIQYMRDMSFYLSGQPPLDTIQSSGILYGLQSRDQSLAEQRREDQLLFSMTGRSQPPSGLTLGIKDDQTFGLETHGITFDDRGIVSSALNRQSPSHSGNLGPALPILTAHLDTQSARGLQGQVFGAGGLSSTTGISQLYGAQYQSTMEPGYHQSAIDTNIFTSGARPKMENTTLGFQSPSRPNQETTLSIPGQRRMSSKALVRHSARGLCDTYEGESSFALPSSTISKSIDPTPFSPPTGPADHGTIIDGPNTQNALQFRPGISPYTQFHAPVVSIRELIGTGKVLLEEMCNIEQSPLKAVGGSKPHNYSVVKINKVCSSSQNPLGCLQTFC